MIIHHFTIELDVSVGVAHWTVDKQWLPRLFEALNQRDIESTKPVIYETLNLRNFEFSKRFIYETWNHWKLEPLDLPLSQLHIKLISFLRNDGAHEWIGWHASVPGYHSRVSSGLSEGLFLLHPGDDYCSNRPTFGTSEMQDTTRQWRN